MTSGIPEIKCCIFDMFLQGDPHSNIQCIKILETEEFHFNYIIIDYSKRHTIKHLKY